MSKPVPDPGPTYIQRTGTILAALIVCLALPAARGSAQDLLWPVHPAPAISSNFCEYREGHLHAGLDIRTSGADGMPCLASGDGYVSRLRASSEGYGKALYVQLDSGQTLVYAHLAEFRPDLEEALLEEQLKRGRYRVSVRYPPDRFRVRSGEVIAWSGSTGGVPPHLHFEIRDEGENPLNPFAHGFPVDDSQLPVIERVRFLPQTAYSRIGGFCWPDEPRIEKTGAGRYSVEDTLVFSGTVGVAVEVFDRLNGRSGRLAPYRIGLAVEDSMISDIFLDRFSFAHDGDVDFLYHMLNVRLEKAYYFQLFENEGESMWNRRFIKGGVLARESVREATGRQITQGVLFNGRIFASDAAGNETVLEFRFYLDDPVTKRAPATTYRSPALASEAGGLFFRNDFVSAKGPLEMFLSPTASRRFGIRGPAATAGQLREPVVVRKTGVAGEDGGFYVYGVEADRGAVFDFPRLDLQLAYGETTSYADLVQFVRACDVVTGNAGELVLRRAPVCLGPMSVVLREDVEIRFRVPGADSTFAVYRLNEKKARWVFYPSEAGGGSVVTRARRPGRYGVFSDDVAPRISAPVVAVRTSYATGARRPRIAVGVEDDGSGVDFKNTTVSIDGVDQIFYFDRPSKKMFVDIHDDNIIGPRRISVVARDQVGNQSTLESTIQIPDTNGARGDNR